MLLEDHVAVRKRIIAKDAISSRKHRVSSPVAVHEKWPDNGTVSARAHNPSTSSALRHPTMPRCRRALARPSLSASRSLDRLIRCKVYILEADAFPLFAVASLLSRCCFAVTHIAVISRVYTSTWDW